MGRLIYLDVWRAFSVLLVVFSHISLNQSFDRSSEIYQILDYIKGYGITGVFIFFFISGYVVSLTCLNEFQSTGDFSIRGFYIRRAFRIVPPLALYIFVLHAVGEVLQIQVNSTDKIFGLLYLCNISLANCGWFTGHTWSLAYEEQFYLIFPIFFMYVYLGRSTGFVRFFLALAFAAVPFFFPNEFVGRTGFLTVYGLFLFGYAAARFWGMLTLSQATLSFVFVIAFLLTFLPFDILVNLSCIDNARHINDVLEGYYRLVLIVSIPAMVLTAGAIEGPMRLLLSNSLLALLGRASYSIYLWQQLVTGLWSEATVVIQVVVLLIMTCLCVALYTYMERPLIQFGRRLARSDTH